MGEKIGVFVAWPYASGDRHMGHVAGAYLPPDIFARYHRLRGNDVIMVSGSDSHGTPVTVRAEQEGVSPDELFLRYHQRFLEGFVQLGLSFDLFTHTDTSNHHQVSQDMFLKLLDKGYVYKDVMKQLYCEQEQRFLPDRYVEGTCPICGFGNARGDQCDNCGHPLDATELIEPRCKFDGSKPVVRETEHFFLDLPAFGDRLLEWTQDKDYWRPNVLNFTTNMLKEGLKPRPITRDIEWGVEVPVEGYQDKRIYVWFEAVIGYLSASIEWAKNQAQPERWREWWQEPARGYYFIGKDNIFFHSIIWPAMLMGYGELNLPYDVPANEYLNLEGRKLSVSRNFAVWLPDYLSRYDPDPLRYYLTANAPENRDTDFSWYDFWRRNNDELLATWGNLAHRVLTFTYRNFEQRVPKPGELAADDTAMIQKVEEAFEPVGNLIGRARFKAALAEVMAVAHEANRYLDDKEPWKVIKEDRQAAATTVYVMLGVINSLKILFYPFLPFSSQKLHEYLGYEGSLMGESRVETFDEDGKVHPALVYDPPTADVKWAPSSLPAGQELRKPDALFKKLDEAIVEEELAKLG
ncbi:MAG: methionine--tRNA ligase [Anaerolineae bacterium]|nr:methionine--tRNA ligase [Anaerolineae bacterium]NIN94661.1 methionine--tRNA ligase [Anaerolineae bacterium]NIQ77727.1 methionine--tRNA ligase [Anaerolineae bacterium]